MRIKKVILIGGMVSILGIVVTGGLLGGDSAEEQGEKEHIQREQVLLAKEDCGEIREVSAEQEYIIEIEEDSNERIEELVAEEQMKYEYQEGIMGRIYFSDTGETAKIMTGMNREDVVGWCEKMVALDPEYLNYEIL